MDSILKKIFRQDLQDYQDFLNCRFPEETGNIQSAPRNKGLLLVIRCFKMNIVKQLDHINQFSQLIFRLQADVVFTVSSGNREGILLIL